MQTTMPWVGFELTTPVFDHVKTVYASDRAAIPIGFNYYTLMKIMWLVSIPGFKPDNFAIGRAVVNHYTNMVVVNVMNDGEMLLNRL
jgi:hypothetical protein